MNDHDNREIPPIGPYLLSGKVKADEHWPVVPASVFPTVVVWDEGGQAMFDKLLAMSAGHEVRVQLHLTVTRKNQDLTSPIFRERDPMPDDYYEAARDLLQAAMQTEPDGQNCALCSDSDHQAFECHHNVLVMARRANALENSWSCFHCEFVSSDYKEAQKHFGASDAAIVSCSRVRASFDEIERIVSAGKAFVNASEFTRSIEEVQDEVLSICGLVENELETITEVAEKVVSVHPNPDIRTALNALRTIVSDKGLGYVEFDPMGHVDDIDSRDLFSEYSETLLLVNSELDRIEQNLKNDIDCGRTMQGKKVWVAAYLRDDAGQVLVRRRAVGCLDAGQWGCPGGKVECESPVDALCRELLEETGLECLSWKLLHVLDQHDTPENNGVVFFYRVTRWTGTLQDEPGKQPWQWVSMDDLVSDNQVQGGLASWLGMSTVGKRVT